MVLMGALRWTGSVVIPACQPVRLTALTPSSMRAWASSAMETCSPVASSMSTSRGEGALEIWFMRPTRPSVVLPMAETATTTSWPSRRVWATRRATCRIRSTSATDEPPNF
ncbi:hypothetical protein D3C86_1160410 [compost metagenome]